MQLITYLLFNGQCEAAFKFYERILGGKIEMMMTHRGTPAESQTPPEWLDKILHARLAVGSAVLMASDTPPGRQETPKGFSVSINVKDVAEAERIFQGLAENGNVHMAIQKTFSRCALGCSSINSAYPECSIARELLSHPGLRFLNGDSEVLRGPGVIGVGAGGSS